MTPAGVFRGSLAARALFCSLVIHCRTTLPLALLVLAWFPSWDLLVSSFFSVYPCNPDMDSVTAGTIKDWYCAANQEGVEMFHVDETESMKQFQRVVRAYQIANIYFHKTEEVGCRL